MFMIRISKMKVFNIDTLKNWNSDDRVNGENYLCSVFSK